MKIILCVLFALYSSLDFWWMNDKISTKKKLKLIILSSACALTGSACSSFVLNLLWYTSDELTQICLMFVLLYHLHPRTRKFEFLKDAQESFLCLNEFGFGLLAGFEMIPIYIFSVCVLVFHFIFLRFDSVSWIQSKWFSIILIGIMLLLI